jgi:hypothetical protein
MAKSETQPRVNFVAIKTCKCFSIHLRRQRYTLFSFHFLHGAQKLLERVLLLCLLNSESESWVQVKRRGNKS